MTVVNVHDAKTNLSRLLVRVARGEEIVIARAGTPVARLTRYEQPVAERALGRDAGLFEVPDDFDEPLPDELLAEFEG
jgi:prevent-host-death family protein